MKFFERVKNMFTEEVEEEVKVEQVKKEVTSDFSVKQDIEDIMGVNVDEEKDETPISKPIFFDENDFKDLNLEPKKEEIKPSEEELYGKKIEPKKVEEKKVFKPTPIISPVYGVLDKNYHKEDIVSRVDVKSNDVTYSEPSIDSIRNKAYGTLEDELENTLFGNNSVLFKHIEEEPKSEPLELERLDDDVLTSLTDDISKDLDELLEKKEKYLNEEKQEEVTDDLLEFIDSTLYKDGDEE